MVACLVVLSAWNDTVQARINVVTLPARDTVQLTIYNSVDLTLVKETRHLTFRKGLNRLEFSWANTLIDPTSVELRPLTQGDAVEVLDVSFPPRTANALEWRINSEVAGEVVVEIRYFTSGITWTADYVIEALRDESSINLSGAVRITNQSGEDYENAQVRLVVGTVRLVEQIAELARARLPGEEGAKPMTRQLKLLQDNGALRADMYFTLDAIVTNAEMNQPIDAKKIVREGLSEYFLYTVEGRDTISHGWSKRLPSFKADEVPLTSYYKFEREIWGERVMRFYRFTNSVASKLGEEPLPDGTVKAFRLATDDKLYAFTGATSVKYIPVRESVDLDLGPDLEVEVKPSLMSWEKLNVQFDGDGNIRGWTVRETWQVEAQNSKEIPITLDVRRNFSGDWKMESTASHENVDAAKVKFVLALKPREKQTWNYVVTVNFGANITC